MILIVPVMVAEEMSQRDKKGERKPPACDTYH